MICLYYYILKYNYLNNRDFSKITETEVEMIDFTKQMKREYTILCPDIFPTHMQLFESIFRINGYNFKVVRYEGKDVIDTGLKYLHNDMCYPAICSCGQLLYALESGDYDTHKTALLFTQTGGGCRASNYIFLLRKALKEMGMEYVPVISMSFSGLEKYSGFKLTPRMILSGFSSLIYGDMILLLKNQTAPYETEKGATDAVVKKWTDELSAQFERKKGSSKKEMRKNLSLMAKDFHDIKREKRDLVKVGIVGEIYVKYSAFANRGLEKFLSTQDVEFMIPGVMGFLQYCAANIAADHKYYGGNFFKFRLGGIAEKILAHYEEYMIEALKPYPEFVAPVSFEKVKELADDVIDRGVKMGEGWLLPGEVAELIEKGYSNVICAQPFGCLPNHIVGKGTIRRLRELYPDANIFPVDYDAGASAVNQENRIKLMLSIARDNMRAENNGNGNNNGNADEAKKKAYAEDDIRKNSCGKNCASCRGNADNDKADKDKADKEVCAHCEAAATCTGASKNENKAETINDDETKSEATA